MRRKWEKEKEISFYIKRKCSTDTFYFFFTFDLFLFAFFVAKGLFKKIRYLYFSRVRTFYRKCTTKFSFMLFLIDGLDLTKLRQNLASAVPRKNVHIFLFVTKERFLLFFLISHVSYFEHFQFIRCQIYLKRTNFRLKSLRVLCQLPTEYPVSIKW